MIKRNNSENVPKTMRDKYKDIVTITDYISHKHLNYEYAKLIRYAIAALCRKRPPPIEKGKPNTWACGVTHALGMVNFMFDKSQTPYMSASDLYNAFGVGQSTGQAKSKLVRRVLGMHQLSPNWTLPS
ncbi:MAG: DUF6398 domain-containing protein [Methylococcales bacterium]